MSDSRAGHGLDTGTPNAARMYDYYLGGKDNFAADRAAADMVLSVAPQMREAARQGRELIGRVVRHLIEQEGIDQIIDIGSGLPTQDNVHQIAHRIRPDTRVVYVDNDDIVCTHGRALLALPDQVAVVKGDLRRPRELMGDAELRRLIDLDRPLAVLMMYVLHLVPGDDSPQEILATYRDILPGGSFLSISHASDDGQPELMTRISAIYERTDTPFTPRSRDEIRRFFGDFDMVPPGLVNIWPFPAPPASVDPALARTGYSGVGRKRG